MVCITGQVSSLVKVCILGQFGHSLHHRCHQPDHSIYHRPVWSKCASQVSLVKVCVLGQSGHSLHHRCLQLDHSICHRSIWSWSASQVSLVYGVYHSSVWSWSASQVSLQPDHGMKSGHSLYHRSVWHGLHHRPVSSQVKVCVT